MDTKDMPFPGSAAWRTAWQALGRLGDGFSDLCRRIRAYNELTDIDPRRLRALSGDRAALERVLRGGAPPHVPRRDP
jgi:hypothetical protein